MKKRYILFQAFPPTETESFEKSRRWSEARSAALNCDSNTKDTSRLGEDAWLIPRDLAKPLVRKLLVAAEAHQISYSIRFLSEKSASL